MIHDPNGAGRPQILLSDRGVSETRERFTVAHEIGHICIGWHFGILECHASEGSYFISDGYSTSEGEANRFASELLMPTDWLVKHIESHIKISEMFTSLVETAKVSPDAARIKLINTLPRGYVCVVARKDGLPPRITPSNGTKVSMFIESGDRLDSTKLCESLNKHCVDSFQIDRYLETVYWYKVDCVRPVPDYVDDRNSRELLKSILHSLFNAELALRQTCSINGIVSKANIGAFARTDEALYASLVLVFHDSNVRNNPNLIKIIGHEHFDRFLVLKARELSSGTNLARRNGASKGRKPSNSMSDEEWNKGNGTELSLNSRFQHAFA